MNNTGELAYKYARGELAYSARTQTAGELIYKSGDTSGWAEISFSWTAGSRDLDILAYWLAYPDMAVGFGTGAESGRIYTSVDGAAEIQWLGDIVAETGAEIVMARLVVPIMVFDFGLRIHFNFYGETNVSLCDVTARQGARKFQKRNQSAAANLQQRATRSDPFCTVMFDSRGVLRRVA